MTLPAWLLALLDEAALREPALQIDWLRAKLLQREPPALRDRAEYDYKVPELDEWLSTQDPAHLTIAAAFRAGELYGAELERGATYQSLDDQENDAIEQGVSLADLVRRSLLRRQAYDFDGPEGSEAPAPEERATSLTSGPHQGEDS